MLELRVGSGSIRGIRVTYAVWGPYECSTVPGTI